MVGSPSEVDGKQLKELGIRIEEKDIKFCTVRGGEVGSAPSMTPLTPPFGDSTELIEV